MSFKGRLWVAVLCAVAAIVLMAVYALQLRGETDTRRSQAIERYGGETVFAYVTTRNVMRGEQFSEKNVDVQEWLVDLLPAGAFVEKEGLMGEYAAANISENTVLSRVNIEHKDEALDVPSNKIAVTVACSYVGAVGGSLVPGDIVDLYTVSQGKAGVLATGIEVLKAAGQGSSASYAVTLAVERELVEAVIASALMQGLYLVLPGSGAEDILVSAHATRDATGSVPAVSADDMPTGPGSS